MLDRPQNPNNLKWQNNPNALGLQNPATLGWQNLVALDWSDVLEKIKTLATSETAKESIQNLAPLSGPEEARDSFQVILSAQNVLSFGHRPYMSSLDLLPAWFGRVKKKAVLKNLEIKDVRAFCLEALALKEALLPAQSDWAQSQREALMDAESPLSAIDQILTPTGEIRMDASEKLYRLFKEKETLSREVHQTMDRLVRDHKMENIVQDKYVTTREGRWVLPVRSGMQHHLGGVIHGSSQTKQTVYMEPEKLIPVNNRLRQIEVEIEDEIEFLLTELSNYLGTLWQDFELSKKILEDCDQAFAKAQLAFQINGLPVEFSQNELNLIDVRHPLLQLSGRPVVSNTVRLDLKKSILLLSGPNAGGKTVLLKSIGLAAQMARCGLLVCCEEGSLLPFFRNIQIGIGDAQSVDEELSTFAAHLKILSQAATLKGPDNLILLDEICGSTDPEEGSALARSFIESYAQNQSFAVITSHLGPLKAGWEPESAILSGSLEYDPKTAKPTYRFVSGVPGDSLAIQTAKRVGVSETIVVRALEILSPATRARLEGLEQIEAMKSDLMGLQEHYKKETQKTKKLQQDLDAAKKQLAEEQERFLQKTLKKAEQKVEEAITQAKVAQTFARHTALQDVKHKLPEIIKAKPATGTPGIENAEEFGRRFPTGSRVYAQSIQQEAVVQSAPNGKGEVLVLAGSMQVRLMWTDLKPTGSMRNPTSSLVRKSSSFTVALAEEDRTIDLRGKTVEEAISELEKHLDQAASQKEDRIKVIHGHGTEALKKSVRTYLSRSVYVKKWKAGTPENGGDGITWVELGEL